METRAVLVTAGVTGVRVAVCVGDDAAVPVVDVEVAVALAAPVAMGVVVVSGVTGVRVVAPDAVLVDVVVVPAALDAAPV